jgi:hypothetical protein
VVVFPVVAVVEVAVVACSFFAHEPRNAAIVSAVIKAKRDVFIGLVKLNKAEDVDPRVTEQALKLPGYQGVRRKS